MPPPQPSPYRGGNTAISAVTGEGLNELLILIESRISAQFFIPAEYKLDAADGKSLAWLHANGKVMEQTSDGEYIHVHVCLSEDNIRRFEKRQQA